jgi:hypothetical protein
VPEANEGVIYQQNKGAADLSGREKQQLLVQRKALANLAGCNDPEGGAGNPNQGRIMAKLFRKCQPDTLGLVSKDNFCQQVGRELRISPADAKVLYDLANNDGAGPGQLDARMFREAFQLVDRKRENAGHVLDNGHREKKRYDPETDKDRPAFWKDAVPSGAQEREAALRRIDAQKGAMAAELAPSARGVLSDARQLVRALDQPAFSKEVRKCFQLREAVRSPTPRGQAPSGPKSVHVRTKLNLSEVQQALFNCPLKIDLPLKSLQTVCAAADINGAAGVTYSQVTQAMQQFVQAAVAADTPAVVDNNASARQKNANQYFRDDHVGCRARPREDAGSAASARGRSSAALSGSARPPLLAPAAKGNAAANKNTGFLQHDMHPEVPPTPEHTTFHKPARNTDTGRLTQAQAQERSNEQHQRHKAANVEKRVRWEESQLLFVIQM